MTASPPLLLGVDGGNTKSIALAATADGSIVGAGRSGGSADVYAVAIDEAIGRLETAADEALSAAGAGPGDVARAAFSLAGADWPEDAEELGSRLSARWPEPVVVNDAIGALRATIPDGPGVVVVLGTGAATAARGPSGATWHSSFWQEADGAHELGVRGMQAVLRAELGIDGPTALRQALLDATGEADLESLLHRWTGRGTRDAFQPRRLAGVVLDTAELGDEAALAIVGQQGVVTGRLAVAAARRVGIPGPFPLALAGGVVRHGGRALRATLLEAVQERAPGSWLLPPAFEPAVGALLLAFDAANVAVTADVDGRLRATLPPAALWDTR